MATAPILSSIISPKFLLKSIRDIYDYNFLTRCEVLKTGINHTYLLSDSHNKYILRIYFVNWRTKQEITEELKFIRFLHQNKISVSTPIKDIDGKYVNTINAAEGKRYMVLFTYAEGEVIRSPSPAICYDLGKTIANMHSLTENITIQRVNYNADTLVTWSYRLAKEHFSEKLEEIKYFKRAVSRITAEFSAINPSEVRQGVVHLDLWYENMKIDKECTITFFDFDNCGNGWLFLDIAYTLMILYKNEPNKKHFIKKRNSLIEGYETINPLTTEEKRLLPYGGLSIWLYYTGIHVFRFDDFSNQFLSPEFLKYWIQTVDEWMKFNNITI